MCEFNDELMATILMVAVFVIMAIVGVFLNALFKDMDRIDEPSPSTVYLSKMIKIDRMMDEERRRQRRRRGDA